MTRCGAGLHEWTETNTRFDSHGWRHCIACETARRESARLTSRPCPWCGTVFTPRRKDKTFCTAACYWKSRREAGRPAPRACTWCGSVFTPHTTQVYCTKLCRREATRSRTPRGPHKFVSHGAAGYSAGCRCEKCSEASRADRLAASERARAANYETVTHGTSTAYKLGCRCPECTAEAVRKVGSYTAPQYDRTLPSARNNRKEWTGADLEIVTRDDLPLVELAQMLGRTLYSVRGTRYRARTDTKWLAIQGVRPTTRPATRVLDKRRSER